MADKEDDGKGFATAMAERGSKHMEVGKAVLEPVTVVGSVFMDSAKAAALNQTVIRSIAAKADIAIGSGQETELSSALADTARRNGMDGLALGKAVDQMLGGGVAYDDARAVQDVLAQFAIGQRVSADDSAKLLTSLNQDIRLPAAHLGGALASVARFGKDNKIERAELAQALPGLLSDLNRLGFSGEEALKQAFAVLRAKKESGSDAGGAARDFHATAEKLRGRGSEAELAAARAAVNTYAPPTALDQGAPGSLKIDQEKARSGSEAKWAEASQARANLSVSIGEALRPASDRAAEALTWLADNAATAVRAFPALTLGVAGVTAVAGTYAALKKTRGMVGAGVGKTLEWMGIGKAQSGADAGGGAGAGTARRVQRVSVTNWRDGGGEGPGLEGRRRRRPLPRGMQAGRVPAGARAGAAGPGLLGRTWAGARAMGSGLLGARNGVSAALNGAPLVRQLAGKIGLIGAVYQGATLVKTLAGNGSDREKADAVGGTVANVAGAVIGGLVGGPAGAMLGSAAGTALWGYFGSKVLDWRDTWKEKPAATPPVRPALAVVTAAPNGPRLPAPAGAVVDTAMGKYMRGLEAPAVPPAPAKTWNGAPSVSLGPVPAVAPVAAVGAAMAAVAAKPVRAAGLSAVPDAEGALQAAASAAAAPTAGARPVAKAGAGAVPAQPNQMQFNFKPTISITVQGDVREPRRIADELMPYLRQLFDQYSGQQRRGSMFDLAPGIGEQTWT